MGNIREHAIRFTMAVLREASDWQEGQTALGDHERYGPWLLEIGGDEMGAITEAQSIIRIAEDRLGDEVPY